MRLISNAVLMSLAWTGTYGAEEELQQLMSKMEEEASSLANAYEEAYASRCKPQTLEQCVNGSYHGCASELPNATCPGGDLSRPFCGDGTACASFHDFTTPTVLISDNAPGGLGELGIPNDDLVKEAVCYSRQADPFLVEDYQKFSEGGVFAKYYGSHTTAFRIFPGRQTPRCGMYDPTRRPWYVAATSGPKDVILIMDMSSDNLQARSDGPDLIKAAVKRIVETLTIADHVAVVTPHPNSPSLLGQNIMTLATRENIGRILDELDSFKRTIPLSFSELLGRAYDLLVESHANEYTSFCHTAILYLTDKGSQNSLNLSSENIVAQIERLNEEVRANPYHFFYSVGFQANSDTSTEVLQEVACKSGGLWSRIESEANLASAMSGYYRLFSSGLGNERFVAWVDPYPYFTGEMGTTVSAPVYDRSVSPPILVGVVGIDFLMRAMDEALGVDSGSRKTLERLVQRSISVCPKLTLNQCEIQSLRMTAGGDEALCPGECTDFVGIKPKPCAEQLNYPEDLWKNIKNDGRTYAERACCSVGEKRYIGQFNTEDIRSFQCVIEASNNEAGIDADATKEATRAGEKDKAHLVGIIIAVVAAVALVGAICMMRKIMPSESVP